MRCPICDSQTPDEADFTIHRHDQGEIPVTVCPTCGHGFALEIPSENEEIAELYDDFYDDERVSPPSRRRSSRALKKMIRRWYGESARIIDIGCNTGSNLLEFGDTDWELHGVELAPRAVQMAREHTRATIHEGLLEEQDLPPNYFDFIIFNGVIEHIREPLGALQTITGLLADGGTLMVGTGDRASHVARVMGRTWPLYFSTGHYHFFSGESLRIAVRRCGLRVHMQRWGGPPTPRSWIPHRREIDELVNYSFFPVKIARVLNSQAWAFMSMPWTRSPWCDHIFVWARR